MKHKLQVAIILLSCVVFLANAQDRTITGNVTSSENGTPIPGVKGMAIGTISDSEGNSNVQVPSDESIIVFTYKGLITQETLMWIKGHQITCWIIPYV